MKRFYNLNAERTKELFKEFFEVDVTKDWQWDSYHAPQSKQTLDTLVSKRGDAAHVAKTESQSPHSIKRSELDKTIRFLKGLVIAMDKTKIAVPID